MPRCLLRATTQPAVLPFVCVCPHVCSASCVAGCLLHGILAPAFSSFDLELSPSHALWAWGSLQGKHHSVHMQSSFLQLAAPA